MLTLAALLALASCGDAPTPSGQPDDVLAPVPDVTFTVPATSTYAGGDVDLEVDGGTVDPQSLAWNATCGELRVDGLRATFIAPTNPGVCTISVYELVEAAAASRHATPSSDDPIAIPLATPASRLLTTIDVTVTGEGRGIDVHLAPREAAITTGESLDLTSRVDGIERQDVAWSATCGTIQGEGSSITFTAPTEPGTCLVEAASLADPRRAAASTITIVEPEGDVDVRVRPHAASVWTDAMLELSAFVTGTSNPGVNWSHDCGQLHAMGPVASFLAPNDARECTVRATSQFDETSDASIAIDVREPPEDLSVVLTPVTASVEADAVLPIAAFVPGAADPSVTWTTTCGTIRSDGPIGALNASMHPSQAPPFLNVARFTAPSQPATCTITAASVEDPAQRASAEITTEGGAAPVTIRMTPATTTLETDQATRFVAKVGGSDDSRVTWSASCGSITSEGAVADYVAPASAGTCTIEATSVAKPDVRATATATVRAPVSVTVSPATADLYQGDTRRFDATVTGRRDATVSWTTDCGAIDAEPRSAHVTAGNEAGTCALTATSNADPRRSFTALITVAGPPSLELTPADPSIAPGASVTFTARTENVGEALLDWSTSCDASLVPSDARSEATLTAGDGVETCSVTVRSRTAPDLAATTTLTIAPDPAITSITVTPEATEIETGDTTTFQADVQVVADADDGVQWTTSDPAIATIDADGVATGVSPGSVTVRATSTFDETAFAEADLVVTRATMVRGVSVTPSDVTLAVGAQRLLEATVETAGPVDTTVTWRSRDEGIAQVDDSGRVTGIAPGRTTVTAASVANEAKTASATITVASDEADPTTSTVIATPSSVPADGSSTSTITITLRDVNGAGVAIDARDLHFDDPRYGTIDDVRDRGEGVYTARYTAGVVARTVTTTVTADGVTLGTPVSIDQTPLATPRRAEPIRISGSYRFSMRLQDDGRVRAWGSNTTGATGYTTGSSTPRLVPGIDDVREIAAGDLYPGSTWPDYGYAVFLDEEGHVYTLGSNYRGGLGVGSSVAATTTPRRVDLPSPVVRVATGMAQVVALDARGRVWLWGYERATGGSVRYEPTLLEGVGPAIDVVATHGNAFALLADGTVMGWGVGYGTGTNASSSANLPPARVVGPGGSGVLEDVHRIIVSGLGAGMYVEDVSGRVWGWGPNRERRTDPTSSASYLLTPRHVTFLPAGSRVAGGWHHAIGLLPDGSMIGWGQNNAWGRLGSDSTHGAQPWPVADLDTAVQIGAGRDHSLAIAADGSVWAWGRNDHATVGDGTTRDRYVPARVIP